MDSYEEAALAAILLLLVFSQKILNVKNGETERNSLNLGLQMQNSYGFHSQLLRELRHFYFTEFTISK